MQTLTKKIIFNNVNAIEENEDVTFFPSYAVFDKDSSTWEVDIQGWIRDPLTHDAIRKTTIAAYSAFAIDLVWRTKSFWRRVQGFMSYGINGEDITIKIGNKGYVLLLFSNGGFIKGKIYLF